MSVINARRIVKANNKTTILEFTDRMGFNDFSENAGVISSTVHSRYSRIAATIVDYTNGKGDKAVVVTTISSLKSSEPLHNWFLWGIQMLLQSKIPLQNKLGFF